MLRSIPDSLVAGWANLGRDRESTGSDRTEYSRARSHAPPTGIRTTLVPRPWRAPRVWRSSSGIQPDFENRARHLGTGHRRRGAAHCARPILAAALGRLPPLVPRPAAALPGGRRATRALDSTRHGMLRRRAASLSPTPKGHLVRFANRPTRKGRIPHFKELWKSTELFCPSQGLWVR